MKLEDLGWRPEFHSPSVEFAPGDVIGRVAVEHRNGYTVYAEDGEVAAELSGRFRHTVTRAGPLGLPAVGDWVVLRLNPPGGTAAIRAVLPRTTQFTRKVAGRESLPQNLAANVDGVFLVSGLNGELNPRRLERYLTLAWECGAFPVFVLNKADLCTDPVEEEARVRAIAAEVPVHVVSARTGLGVEALAPYFANARTMAFLGSSGVGKSSLINRLLGREHQSTQDVRDDGKGRHTTTRRELLLRPGGGLVLDTPGMRELQIWEGTDGVETAFADIEDIAGHCRFRDCLHVSEPGCAVREAVRTGLIPAERVASFHKLRGELRHLEAKQDHRTRADLKRESKRLTRAGDDWIKRKRAY